MTEMLLQYGLFLAEAVTVVVAIGVVIALVAGLTRREHHAERLEVKHLNAKYAALERAVKREVLPRKQFRAQSRGQKKALKARSKARGEPGGKRLFVLNFRGDLKATAVASLREEVTALLTIATPDDEVLLRLDNSGGMVHEHGLAAAQLLRIRKREIPLTVAVDKMAASGGYMMACVAERILAAPFAVLGSIGVLMQLPNFHRWLDAHGVDFEQVKGGQYKRTLTLFGENTESDRAKVQEEIEGLHQQFKGFVAEHRPVVDLDLVGSGEHWYGARALELKLCDALETSDDYLLSASRERDIYELRYVTRKSLSQRLASGARTLLERTASAWTERQRERQYAG